MADEPWRIEYLESVVDEDIPALPKRARERIKRAVEHRLMVDPIGHGKPLRSSRAGAARALGATPVV